MEDMSADEYNYAVFNLKAEMGKFAEFQDDRLHPGREAPDFPLEDLETSQTVRLKDLWSDGLVVIEFGSFT
jgi:hypothetical protein